VGGLEGPDCSPPVARPPVPDEDDPPAHVPQHLSDEAGDGMLVEVAVGEGAEVEAQPAPAGGDRQGRDE
jgi:hypothetical protein